MRKYSKCASDSKLSHKSSRNLGILDSATFKADAGFFRISVVQPVIGVVEYIDDLIDIGNAGVRIRVDIIHT